ncbi:MAG: hypothetical protein KatS3mg111_1715 [Pirellulaceae bacterium]|nr:MAG: hypothetical protein KatS3mg111_1715 [Pirellulaceae bacterium]
MDEHSKRLVEMIEGAFNRFRSGDMSIVELASSIEGIASGLEASAGDSLTTTLNSLVGKLEHIHFMCQPEEQNEMVLEEIEKVERMLHSS